MFELIPMDRRMNRYPAFDPFRELDELERKFFSAAPQPGTVFRTDVSDRGDAFLIESELPGFRKEDIEINIENDCLTITAERKTDETEEKKNFIRRERFYGSFSRSFDVSGVNVDGIEAEYNNGILSLTLPKKEEEIPASRRLEIK